MKKWVKWGLIIVGVLVVWHLYVSHSAGLAAGA